MPQTINNMVATWNNAATTFTFLKANITDTASSASSLLMDLQVGGSSRARIDKAGTLELRTNNGISAIWTGFGTSVFGSNISTSGERLLSSVAIRAATTQISLRSTGEYTWTNVSNDALATIDLFLTRRAAANLRLGAADAAAPVAQTLSVQSVVAGTTNTAGANLTITGSQGTGTGAGGSIIFQVAPAGSSGTAQNALQNALLIDSDGQATFTIKNTSGTPSLQIAKFGSSSIQITTTATFSIGSSASSLTLNANAGSSPIYAAGSYLNIGSSANNDVQLSRDAANTLALRNGANAQTFNLYGTYTDASNYERLSLYFSGSNDFALSTSKAGTGSNRSLTFETYGAATFTIAAQTIATSNDGFFSWSSTSSSRGSTDTRLYRDAAGIVGVRGSSSTTGAALSFVEQTAPAAPATNGVRIYAEDNGSGKTRLMALFATGAAVQIAIEP